jgi:hypothetical protein
MLKIIFVTTLFLLVPQLGHAGEAVQAAEIEQDAPSVPSTQASTAASHPSVLPEHTSSATTADSQRTNNDKLTDYRHCLDLKTNIEIIKCRYKK